MKIDVQKQVAIITNAARGIGGAIAKVLLENGATVYIADTIDGEGDRMAGELRELGICRYFHVDVTRSDEIDEFIKTVRKACGRIDIMVNNVGVEVGSAGVDIQHIADNDWDMLVDVNMRGVFYCCRAVSKVMIEQHYGRIVNLSSVLGIVPMRKEIASVTADAGLQNLTKALSLELGGYDICVNGVAVGSISADGRADKNQNLSMRQMLSHVPLSRYGTFEDVANAVLFLCGRENGYITGHILTVDGGWTCGYHRDF